MAVVLDHKMAVRREQRPEPLSDDFLFSMSSSTENRLSYASSPESDLEVSPPPAPRLVKSSSDPSIATTQDNMDRDDDMNHMGDAVPPPYTVGTFIHTYSHDRDHNFAITAIFKCTVVARLSFCRHELYYR